MNRDGAVPDIQTESSMNRDSDVQSSASHQETRDPDIRQAEPEMSRGGVDSSNNKHRTTGRSKVKLFTNTRLIEHLNGAGYERLTKSGRLVKPNTRFAFAAQLNANAAKKQFGTDNTDAAIVKELDIIGDKEVWEFQDSEALRIAREESNGRLKILPSSLFLKEKFDAFGVFEKLKARLVCCGNFRLLIPALMKEVVRMNRQLLA